MRVLHIDTSALGAGSASRELSAAVVAALRTANSGVEVSYRDLHAQPLAHADGPLLRVLRPELADGSTVPASMQAEVDRSEALLAEFLAADLVVVGAPMYNFSVPSVLKAWIDRVVLPRRTFTYTATGPQGLVHGKRVIVVSTRGSQMAGKSFEAAMDHQEAYLRAVFSFIGVTDLQFLRAEGLGFGPEVRKASLEAATLQAAGLATAPPPAISAAAA